MRIDFSTGEELESWEPCPLSLSELRDLFRWLVQELKSEAEFQKALGILGLKSVGSLQIHLCEDSEMRSFQKQYRNLDRTTDVLSFPSIEVPEIAMQFASLPKTETTWGSLVLSHSAIKRGALRGRRSLKLEYMEVLIHGFLHLLGFDHVTGQGVSKADAQRMRSLQAQLFEQAKGRF